MSVLQAKFAILAACFALAWGGSLPASEVLVADFEDVPTLKTGFVLPTRDGFAYAGLIWTGFYVIDSEHGITEQFPRGGYRTGRISGRFAAVGALRNAAHSEVRPDTEASFDVLSLYITSAWRNGLLVRLEGLRGTESVVHEDLTLAGGRRQRLELGFEAIDVLRISAAGGQDAGLCEGRSCSPGPEIVLDDVVFRIRSKAQPAPAPSVEITEAVAPEPKAPAPRADPAPKPEVMARVEPNSRVSPDPPSKPQPSAKKRPPAPATSRRVDNQIASGVCGAKPYYGAQVGAFASKGNALNIAEELRAADTLVQIHEKARQGKKPLFFVVAGCFEERVQAARLVRKIRKDGVDSFVTRASIRGLGPLVLD